MPDEMYVVYPGNDSCQHISITHRRCRLHDICGPSYDSCKHIAEPTYQAAHHYRWGPSSGIGCCRCHYVWKSSSSLELMSCGVERCSRGLETTGRPTNRRSSVGAQAKVVFESRS